MSDLTTEHLRELLAEEQADLDRAMLSYEVGWRELTPPQQAYINKLIARRDVVHELLRLRDSAPLHHEDDAEDQEVGPPRFVVFDPYDWGPDGPPEGKPLKHEPGKGWEMEEGE